MGAVWFYHYAENKWQDPQMVVAQTTLAEFGQAIGINSAGMVRVFEICIA